MDRERRAGNISFSGWIGPASSSVDIKADREINAVRFKNFF
ncbi:hypothetical protein [Methanosarcina sp.]|jgi:hypothetical protein